MYCKYIALACNEWAKKNLAGKYFEVIRIDTHSNKLVICGDGIGSHPYLEDAAEYHLNLSNVELIEEPYGAMM